MTAAENRHRIALLHAGEVARVWGKKGREDIRISALDTLYAQRLWYDKPGVSGRRGDYHRYPTVGAETLA